MKVFVEEQIFDQWRFRLLIIAVIGLMVETVVIGYSELKENPTELWTTITTIGLSVILILFIVLFLKFETKIDEQGVHYGFRPIQIKLKPAPWNKI